MKFLVVFVVLSIINVVFSTIRSITTIKSGKGVASLISGGYFAFYNIMLVYTVADFPMWQKCVITFFCNVIGVYLVKLFEEKSRKDRLWKIEVTVKRENAQAFSIDLLDSQIPYSCIDIDKHIIFNIYCATQADSIVAKILIEKYNAKYFVSESKIL